MTPLSPLTPAAKPVTHPPQTPHEAIQLLKTRHQLGSFYHLPTQDRRTLPRQHRRQNFAPHSPEPFRRPHESNNLHDTQFKA
jgi:hypothetical protein